MKYLARNLYFLRISKGLKQTEIPDTIGFKRTTWSTWEIGNAEPSIDNLLVIANYFGVTLDDIVVTNLEEKGKVNENSPPNLESEKGKEKGKVTGKVNEQKDNKQAGLKDSNAETLKQLTDVVAQLQKEMAAMRKKR